MISKLIGSYLEHHLERTNLQLKASEKRVHQFISKQAEMADKKQPIDVISNYLQFKDLESELYPLLQKANELKTVSEFKIVFDPKFQEELKSYGTPQKLPSMNKKDKEEINN